MEGVFDSLDPLLRNSGSAKYESVPLLKKGIERKEASEPDIPLSSFRNRIHKTLDKTVVWLFRKYSRANILHQMEGALNEGLQLMQVKQLLIVVNTLVWLGTTDESGVSRISVGLFLMIIAIQGLTILLNKGSTHKGAHELRFAFRESPQFLFAEMTRNAELNVVALAAVSILVLAVQAENDLILVLSVPLGLLYWAISNAEDQYTRYCLTLTVFFSFCWMKYLLVKNTTFTVNYYELEVPVNLSLLYALYAYIDYLLLVVFFPAFLLLLYVQHEINPDKIMAKGDKLSNYTLEEFIHNYASPAMCRVYFTAAGKESEA
jgi:hypothetical protein